MDPYQRFRYKNIPPEGSKLWNEYDPKDKRSPRWVGWLYNFSDDEEEDRLFLSLSARIIEDDDKLKAWRVWISCLTNHPTRDEQLHFTKGLVGD